MQYSYSRMRMGQMIDNDFNELVYDIIFRPLIPEMKWAEIDSFYLVDCPFDHRHLSSIEKKTKERLNEPSS
jgi:hypothetical protein